VTNNQILSKQIIIDGLLVNYYYTLSDKKTSKTLIFLHGWGVDSRLWFKILPETISKNYSMFFLDLPGFGQSQTPKIAYDVEDYKKIVCEFIRKLELKKINLIGHSFGGRISIKLASENPNFLEKIVLVNTAGIVPPSKTKKLITFISKVISPIFKPNFMQPLRRKLYFLLDSEYLENEKLSQIFSKVVSENLTHLLELIKRPALIVWGRNDLVTPLHYGELTNKLIPKSKLVIIEDAGHFSFLDQPKEFVKALTNFI
jgi:pimeloyl-ACP methyl ester carboxylesterase